MSYPGSYKKSKSASASAGSKKRRKGSRQSGYEQRVVVAEMVPASASLGTTRVYTAPQTVAQYQTAKRLQEHKTFDFHPAGNQTDNNVLYTNPGTVPAVAPTYLPTTGDPASLICINQVPQGNSSVTREGRRLNITALQMRGVLFASEDNTITKVSILLIWDRNPNTSATLPAWNEILNSQNAISLTNKDGAPRFKILRRWEYELLGGDGTALTEKSEYCFDEYITMKNKVTQWTTADTSGSYANMQEGALYVGVVSTTDVANIFYVNTRLYFGDH